MSGLTRSNSAAATPTPRRVQRSNSIETASPTAARDVGDAGASGRTKSTTVHRTSSLPTDDGAWGEGDISSGFAEEIRGTVEKIRRTRSKELDRVENEVEEKQFEEEKQFAEAEQFGSRNVGGIRPEEEKLFGTIESKD